MQMLMCWQWGAAGGMAEPCSQGHGTSAEKGFKKGQKNWPREECKKKKCEKQPYRPKWEEEEEVLQVAKQIIHRGTCQPLEEIMMVQVSTLQYVEDPGEVEYSWRKLHVWRVYAVAADKRENKGVVEKKLLWTDHGPLFPLCH